MICPDLCRAYCARISTDPDSIPGRRIMEGDADKAPGFVAFRDEVMLRERKEEVE